MQHATQVQLLQRALALLEQGVSDCAAAPSALRADSYLDEARFRRERDEILRCEPLLVARSAEIAAGHFITRDLLAPLLLTRDDSGRLRGFLNVCKHRGTQLVSEPGGATRVFVCPYHAWAYNPDGQLRGIPHAYGFDGIERGCLNLTEVPVAECWGGVWARHSPGPALDLPAFFGPQLMADFASFGVDRHVLFDPRDITRPVNWKLTIDTFLENYHVQKAHQATIDHLFQPNLGLFERLGRHIRNYYVKRNLVELLDQPESAWNLRRTATCSTTCGPTPWCWWSPTTSTSPRSSPPARSAPACSATPCWPRSRPATRHGATSRRTTRFSTAPWKKTSPWPPACRTASRPAPATCSGTAATNRH